MTKRTLAALATVLAFLFLGAAQNADAARLRGYISKLHVGSLATGAVGQVWIYTSLGTFCGVARLDPLLTAHNQLAFESARESLLAQAPGTRQHFTIWWTDDAPGLCGAGIGDATAFFFYQN